MEKKAEKKTYEVKKYLKIGFWVMIVLFILTILLNMLSFSLGFFAYLGLAVQILMYLTVLFVFVHAILCLSPEKGFTILALILSSVLLLILLLLLSTLGTKAV
jgi:hypothetical protein